MITGSYVSPASPRGAGFVGEPGKLTILPPVYTNIMNPLPNELIAAPSGLNDGGAVIGTFFLEPDISFFVWQDGKYVTTFLGGEGGVVPAFLPFIGTSDHVSFNISEDFGIVVPIFGKLSATRGLQNTGGFPQIASINANLEVAGQVSIGCLVADQLVGTAVFTYAGQKMSCLLPPTATNSYGGWLNDHGQVAGSYSDAKGGLHGFLYTAGAYKSFDMPTKPLALTVQGIDVAGRVVGTYEDAQGSYGFVYGGGTVTKLGAFLRKASIQVSISRATDRIAISATLPGGARSFLATCVTGTGC
jgi:hypothetical protein